VLGLVVWRLLPLVLTAIPLCRTGLPEQLNIVERERSALILAEEGVEDTCTK